MKKTAMALGLCICLAVTGMAAAATKAVAATQSTSNKATKAVKSTSNLININTATADQLQNLPHIGPKLAQKIIDYRAKNGKFKSLDDLTAIRGISEARVKSFNGLATV